MFHLCFIYMHAIELYRFLSSHMAISSYCSQIVLKHASDGVLHLFKVLVGFRHPQVEAPAPRQGSQSGPCLLLQLCPQPHLSPWFLLHWPDTLCWALSSLSLHSSPCSLWPSAPKFPLSSLLTPPTLQDPPPLLHPDANQILREDPLLFSVMTFSIPFSFYSFAWLIKPQAL